MQKQLCIPALLSQSELFLQVENQRTLLEERQQILQRILKSQQPNHPETSITRELVQQELTKIIQELSQLPKSLKASSNQVNTKIEISKLPLSSPKRVIKQEIDTRAKSNSEPICFMMDGEEAAIPPQTPDVVHCPASIGRVNLTARGNIPIPSLAGHREYSYDSEYSEFSEEYGFYLYTHDTQTRYEPIYDRAFDTSTPIITPASITASHSSIKSPKHLPTYKIHKKRLPKPKPDKKKLYKSRMSDYNPITTPIQSSTPIVIQVPSYPIYSPYPSSYSYNPYPNLPVPPQYSYQPEHSKTDHTPTSSHTHKSQRNTLESATQCSMVISPSTQEEKFNKSSICGYSGLGVSEDSYNKSTSFRYSYSPDKKDVSVEIVPKLEMSQQYPEPPIVIIPRDPWSAEYGSLRGKKLAEVFQDKRPEAFHTIKEREETLGKVSHKNKSRKELLKLRKEMLQAPTNKIRKLIQNRD